jgi:hypothetical protein
MYKVWTRSSLADFVVVPVAVLAPVYTADQLLVQEQRWIDALGTLAPLGYNRCRAVALARMPHVQQLHVRGRYYGYSDMRRRLLALARATVPGPDQPAPVFPLNQPETALQHLAHFRLRTLQCLHAFCVDVSVGLAPAPLGMAGHLLVSIQGMLVTALSARTRPLGSKKHLLRLQYSSLLLDGLKFGAAFSACAHLLPAGAVTHPTVAYRLSTPLGRYWVNTTRWVLQQQPPDEHELCVCADPALRRFIPTGCQHVCTTNSSIVNTVYHARRHPVPLSMLRFLWHQGYAHRLQESDVSSQSVTEEQLVALQQHLQGRLARCAARLAREGPPEWVHSYTVWATAVLQHLRGQLPAEGSPLRPLLSQRSTQLPRAAVFDVVLSFIRDMQRRFVITRCDKLGHAYVAMCPALFVAELRRQMDTDCFQPYLQGELAAVDDAGYALPDSLTGLQVGDGRLAVSGLLVKFHKDPVAFRMLCCCSAYYHADAGRLLTGVMAAMLPEVSRLWSAQLRATGLDQVQGPHRPWFITDTMGAVQQMQELTADHWAFAEFAARGGVVGKDFQQMYTHVPHADLLARVRDYVLVPAWRHHYAHQDAVPFTTARRQPQHAHLLPVLKVYAAGSGGKARWFRDTAAAVAHRQAPGVTWFGLHGQDRGGTFYFLTLSEVNSLLAAVVEHVYIACFGLLYHQVKGIPMGVSPGVYLANYYLFSYELQHMQCLGRVLAAHPANMSVQEALVWGERVACHPGAMRTVFGAHLDGCLALYVWQQWRYVLRFVDDLQVVGHRWVNQLLYTDQRLHGTAIAGVYPRHCPLQDTPPPHPNLSEYLDLQMRFVNVQGRLAVETTLHDKRRKPAFQRLHASRYTHATSAVSGVALGNICASQTLRLLRLVNTVPARVSELAMLTMALLRQGYQPAFVRRHMARTVSRRPWLWLRATATDLMARVHAMVADLQGLVG